MDVDKVPAAVSRSQSRQIHGRGGWQGHASQARSGALPRRGLESWRRVVALPFRKRSITESSMSIAVSGSIAMS